MIQRAAPSVAREAGRWWWRRVTRARPTRDGWWCLFVAMGLGAAAVNTGNNLAYLLCSTLLALIVVSGLLSDLSMRSLALATHGPDELYAGRPALFEVSVTNRKRRLPAYSVNVEPLRVTLGRAVSPTGGGPGELRLFYVTRLEPGGERLWTWEVTPPARGRRRLPGLRLTTRFPFGLFVKAGPTVPGSEVLVYPAVGPVSAARVRELGEAGVAPSRRRGRGHDLYNLRPYRPGDDPRLIHWPSTAKAQSLTVRELEEETARDTRLVLDGTGAKDPARLEAALSEAASLVVHLIEAGTGVELTGPGLFVPLGRGRGQARRLLAALALYQSPWQSPWRSPGESARSPMRGTPPAAEPEVVPSAPSSALREIRIGLD